MKKLALLLLALAPFAASVEAAPLDHLKKVFSPDMPPQPPSIAVLIVHDRPGALLEVKGRYKLFDPRTNSYISSRFIGKRKFIQAVHDGLRWGEEFPGLHQLLIIPEDPKVTTVVDGIEYRGSIYIYDVEGQIAVVNGVNIEDYLKSILARRYLTPLSAEAAAAAAINERTKAYYQAANPTTPYWAVDAQEVGYKGFAVTGRNVPIEEALDATKYLVMSDGEAGADSAHPFLAAQWESADSTKGAVAPQIKLEQAEEMAKRGDHAAQILAKAYPGRSLQLMFHETIKR